MNKREDFIPFAKPSIGEEEINEVIDTLKKGWLTTGEKTFQFEQNLKNYINSQHAIAVNSGTAALHLALIATGIKEGDEVITTSFTFTATAEVITYLNAKPVFVDIDENTFNINPDLIEAKITEKTKAIIPVHFGGNPCDLNKIKAIAEKHSLKIIEDAAHALGAKYHNQMIGTIGDLTAFSFYATKNLTTGEGGMITTNNQDYAEQCQILRLHGINKDAVDRYKKTGTWYYEVVQQGYKYNLSDIQASIGIQQLNKFNFLQEKRKSHVQLYQDLLKDVPEISFQQIQTGGESAWHLFTIKIDFSNLNLDRAKLIEELKQRNIGANVHFIPLHLHSFYQQKYHYKEGDFPSTEKVYQSIVSLPLFPAMSEEDVHYISENVKKIIEQSRIKQPEIEQSEIKKKPKVVAIIAARMNSTRMYGKPIKLVTDKSVIELCIERLQKSKLIDQFIIATSTKEENKIFVDLAKKLNIDFYIGDEDDVLDRFYQCGKLCQADHIVRVTSENPLMYIENLDELIQTHLDTNADFTYTDNLPLGCFIEIISLNAFKTSWEKGEKKHHSELITLFIYENKELFKINKFDAPLLLQKPHYRLTVDTEQDLQLMKIIYEHFGDQFITLKEAVKFLDQNPELVKINSHIPVGEARVWK